MPRRWRSAWCACRPDHGRDPLCAIRPAQASSEADAGLRGFPLRHFLNDVSVQRLLRHSYESIATNGLTAYPPSRNPSNAMQGRAATRGVSALPGGKRQREASNGCLGENASPTHRRATREPQVERTMSRQPQGLTANPGIAGHMFRNRCGAGAPPRKRPALVPSGLSVRSLLGIFLAGRLCGPAARRRIGRNRSWGTRALEMQRLLGTLIIGSLDCAPVEPARIGFERIPNT